MERRKKRRVSGKHIVLGCFAAALMLALLLFAGERDMGLVLRMTLGRPLTVGNHIAAESISEFYYTLSTSTDPPHYQRYRFYLQDGSWQLFCETREGQSWPLTEKDITHSAAVSLSDADTAELMRCLQGGAVTRRGSGTETGGREPALYLYWQQDGGEYQQFSFAGYEQRSAFEALCARLCG